jgi:hypothetical protein
MKMKNILKITVVFLAALLLSCGGRSETTIRAQGVEILGPLSAYVTIPAGKYTVKINETDKSVLVLGLDLELLKTYPGDPAEAAAGLAVIPTDKAGIRLEGYHFTVSSMDKFANLLEGEPGRTSLITFRGTVDANIAANKKPGFARAVFRAVRGFEGTVYESSVDDEIVVAVSALAKGEDVPDNIAAKETSELVEGLRQNRYVTRVVDYSQVERIMEQHRFEAGDWSNSDKVAEIGRALNANVIIIGTITLSGKTPGSLGPLKLMDDLPIYSVGVQLLDVNTMEILGALNVNNTNTSSVSLAVSRMEIRR